MSKILVPSLDYLFSIFEVEPSLPDPRSYRDGRVLVRPKMTRHTLADLEKMPESSVYETEEFQRVPLLRNQETGESIFFWIKSR
jgi:hypothetical protein